MKNIILYILLLIVLCSGCVGKNTQTMPEPTFEYLELIAGKTTVADVNRLIIPTFASPMMAMYRISRQNVILNIYITDANGVSYTNSLDLRVSSYALKLSFAPNGTLLSYMLMKSYR